MEKTPCTSSSHYLWGDYCIWRKNGLTQPQLKGKVLQYSMIIWYFITYISVNLLYATLAAHFTYFFIFRLQGVTRQLQLQQNNTIWMVMWPIRWQRFSMSPAKLFFTYGITISDIQIGMLDTSCRVWSPILWVVRFPPLPVTLLCCGMSWNGILWTPSARHKYSSPVAPFTNSMDM